MCQWSHYPVATKFQIRLGYAIMTGTLPVHWLCHNSMSKLVDFSMVSFQLMNSRSSISQGTAARLLD